MTKMKRNNELVNHKKKSRVVITGAAGQIGYALAFRIASGQMFGDDTSIDLVLLELPQALPALNGVLMELEDCAFPLLNSVTCTSDLEEGFKDADWCLLVGAMPRKAGMERRDLLSGNGAIFKKQGRVINDVAGPDVRMLVIGNPCNTNACILKHHAPDIPDNRFFAMTMLDENRARAQLAKKAGVAYSDVDNMIIWGNHSSTLFPDFSHAQIRGQSAVEVIDDQAWFKHEFIETVQKRGAAIIQARGASSSASAANAIVDTVACLSGYRQRSSPFSVALCSQGEYDSQPGLIVSLPCRMRGGSCEVVPDIEHDAFAQTMLKQTLDELVDEYQCVQELGFI